MPKSDFDDRFCFSSLFGFSSSNLTWPNAKPPTSNEPEAPVFPFQLDAAAAGSPFSLTLHHIETIMVIIIIT
jgi:hypothetical protein